MPQDAMRKASMKIVRIALLVIGVLATLMGLTWAGQGSGYFPYPPQSFMIDQTPWIYRGAALAAVGIVLIVLSRRIGSRPAL
jgi:heme/copper-type cytochrome/quinol oxidase subunit 1